MNPKVLKSIAMIVSCMLTPCIAQAGLTGATVDVIYYYPDLSTVYADLGDAVVGSSVEYPNFQNQLSIDVADESLTFTQLSDTPYAAATFNGFELNILPGGPELTSVSLDPSSTFDLSSFGLANGGSSVFLNLQGQNIPEGDTIILDFTSAAFVPEPATWAMMLIGFGGVGATMRSRRKQALASD